MNRIWNLTENIMRFVLFKLLHLKLSDMTWKRWCQFVKFGLVGLSNTFISYVVYVVLVSFSIYYLIASLIAFLISIINAYYWNNSYVFKTERKHRPVWWKVFFKTFASYAGTSLILNNILLVMWVEIVGINEVVGPIINLFIIVPLNFLLNKYWAFKNVQ